MRSFSLELMAIDFLCRVLLLLPFLAMYILITSTTLLSGAPFGVQLAVRKSGFYSTFSQQPYDIITWIYNFKIKVPNQ